MIWSLKKGLRRVDKTQCRFLVTSVCLLSKCDECDEHDDLSKYDELFESIAFAQNIEVF